jgi:chromosome segregation ATPase
MSEEPTQNLPSLSFEERVLAEFAAIRQEFAAQREMITQLHTRMTSLEGRMASLEGRMTSLEDRVLSIDTRLTSLEDRVLSIDVRLASLEDKVDARLRETRPIWEGVQQRLTEIEKSVTTISRHFKTMVSESFDLRSRLEKLEDSQPMP